MRSLLIASPKLHAVVDRGYEEDAAIDPKVAEYLHISEAFEHAAEFDHRGDGESYERVYQTIFDLEA